jgi:hypothetical protein
MVGSGGRGRRRAPDAACVVAGVIVWAFIISVLQILGKQVFQRMISASFQQGLLGLRANLLVNFSANSSSPSRKGQKGCEPD